MLLEIVYNQGVIFMYRLLATLAFLFWALPSAHAQINIPGGVIGGVVGGVLGGPVGTVLGGAVGSGAVPAPQLPALPPGVVPQNLSCAYWTANPYYFQVVQGMQMNISEFIHYGITNRNTCQSRRDILAGEATRRFGPGVGAATWDMGRCACYDVYPY